MTQAGSVYGEALYSLCREEALTQTVLQQLSALQESFGQEPDFIRLLSSPALSKAERCQILENSFRDKVHPYVLNFLKILTEKGYIRHFTHCCDAYRSLYNQDHGILPVIAVTACPLTDDQAYRLTQKLSGLTGKTIELTNQVDPAVLGGVRLDYDGKRVDDTVAHRLERIHDLLQNTVL